MFKKGGLEVVVFRDLERKISSKASTTLKKTLENYGNNISLKYKYVIHDFSSHNQVLAVKAIHAARNQNKEEDYYRLVVKSNGYTKEQLLVFAQSLRLNMSKFKEDLESKELINKIKADKKDAESSGLSFYPGITINGIPYKGAWDKESIIAALKKNGATQIRVAMQGLFQWGASAAIALILATIAALLLVNFGNHEVYEHLKKFPLGFTYGNINFSLPVEVWINDFLMAIFFLLIGLEIKEEILEGELSNRKKAAMPVIAAIGGMLVPALLYIIFNFETDTAHGWGVPMATDIAFTLGLMAILGSRVPVALKVFISALAIADDLGAILIIALFYGHGFHLNFFLLAMATLLIMYFFNRKKVFNVNVYLFLGLLLWFFIYKSGLHATLAGVLTAFLIPVQGKANLSLIAKQIAVIFQKEIGEIKNPETDKSKISPNSLLTLKRAIERLREPSEYLMHNLERFVNFIVLPLFAFFNTGILLTGSGYNFNQPLSLGIIAGLLIGKPLGILGFTWLASKLKIAKLSNDIRFRELFGGACLAGIGFTMSIVVGSSAFTEPALTTAKISILLASTLSAVLGLVILYLTTKTKDSV